MHKLAVPWGTRKILDLLLDMFRFSFLTEKLLNFKVKWVWVCALAQLCVVLLMDKKTGRQRGRVSEGKMMSTDICDPLWQNGDKVSVLSLCVIDTNRKCNQGDLVWHTFQNCITPKWSYGLFRQGGSRVDISRKWSWKNWRCFSQSRHLSFEMCFSHS